MNYIAYNNSSIMRTDKRSTHRRTPATPRLSGNALTVLQRRYLSKDARGRVIETPRRMFARVAANLAQAERLYQRKETTRNSRRSPAAVVAERDVAKMFERMLSSLEFLPNSPTLMNAARELQQLSACFVLPVDDSLESIFDTVKHQALIHQSGGGTGFSFSHLRPKGDMVHTTSGVASGPVSFMRVFNMATEVIKQGGTRRGANMGILRVDHPDILEFIDAKQDLRELTNFNISVGITDVFMGAVEQGRDYPLVNPRTGRAVRRIKANEVFDRLTSSAWQNGEPGVIFLDTINAASPTPHIGLIEATNPCVTGDTWVQTDEGPRQVIDLIGVQFGAQVDGRSYLTTHEGFFKTGTKPVLQLRTVEGYKIRLTPDHPIRRITRKARYTLESEWRNAGELCQGDLVLLNDHRGGPTWQGSHTFEEGYLLGLLVGDGTLKDEKAVLSVWETNRAGNVALMAEALRCTQAFPHRSDFKGWFAISGRDESRLALASLRDLALSCGMTPGDKSITPHMERGSSDFYRGFLRGFFDTDGSVQGNSLKGISVRLAQADLSRLDAVQRMLLRLGIASRIYLNRREPASRILPNGKGGTKEYPTQSQHELVISGENLARFYDTIGFSHGEKALKLTRLLSGYRRILNRERFVVRVEEVVEDGVEDVFDITVPGMHAFDANGFMVHNCGEQPLLAYESCTLGSVNLAKFVRRVSGGRGKPAVDFARLALVIRNAVRFLDNVLDMNHYPLPQIEEMTRGNRKIGLGIMGFADLLIQLDIPYHTDEALSVGERIMRFVLEHARAASAALARERGVFPNFKGSRLESEGLALRNATLTTVAPTGTISIIADCSPGIEPLYGVSFIRTVMEDVRLVSIHPEFVRRAKAEGIFTPALARRVAANESIQDLSDIPGDLRRLFVTAHDIPADFHVRMQAAFQRYSDSGVSKTINLPASASQRDVAEAFLLAHRLGCKGLTVFRSGSREKQVMSCANVQYC